MRADHGLIRAVAPQAITYVFASHPSSQTCQALSKRPHAGVVTSLKSDLLVRAICPYLGISVE
jgi:hypothetical protein